MKLTTPDSDTWQWHPFVIEEVRRILWEHIGIRVAGPGKPALAPTASGAKTALFVSRTGVSAAQKEADEKKE